MKDESEILQVEVGGTTITLGRDEAALVLYADCKHRGEEAIIIYGGVNMAKAYIVERKVGDSSICAAIFPRIQSFYSKNTSVLLSSGSRFKLGSDNKVTVYAGNVTEAYLEDR